MSKLSASQRSAIRAGAQDFARRADLDVNVEDAEFSDLASLKADARRAARDLADKVQSLPEGRAAETEAAQAAILDLVDLADQEMDARTARGDRSPTSRINPATAAPREARESRVYGADGEIVSGGEPVERSYSLRPEQRMSTWAAARKPDDEMATLSTGRYLRSMILGAETDVERRALAEGSDSAGGFTVPTILSARLIDALRAESVVTQAGAQMVPLTSDAQSIAAVATDPVPAWRSENASVAESGPTFRSVPMAPKSLAVMTKVSRELFEDSVNLEAELPRILAAAMAVELDRVALLGSGSAPEPLGVANTAGIGTTAHDAALTAFAPLVTARTGILAANAGPVTAYIAHPRDEGELTGLIASDGQPLNAPGAVAAIPMLTTTSIPVDGGAGSDESTIIAGNFAHLLIGMRSEIRVEVLRERFADSHQFAMVAHLRADIAVEHAAAFHTITGIQG